MKMTIIKITIMDPKSTYVLVVPYMYLNRNVKYTGNRNIIVFEPWSIKILKKIPRSPKLLLPYSTEMCDNAVLEIAVFCAMHGTNLTHTYVLIAGWFIVIKTENSWQVRRREASSCMPRNLCLFYFNYFLNDCY